jgi:hypothetical protein
MVILAHIPVSFQRAPSPSSVRVVVGGDLYCSPHDDCYAGAQPRLPIPDVELGPVPRAPDACARQGGVHREVRQIMSGLLPVFLPRPGERANAAHTRALEFAAEVAGCAGARGTIPEVAGIAARDGSSGLIRAARRLDEHLGRA